ncbi:MAG: hypothetical protein WDN24_01905 [Sphingomonas sp.]
MTVTITMLPNAPVSAEITTVTSGEAAIATSPIAPPIALSTHSPITTASISRKMLARAPLVSSALRPKLPKGPTRSWT